MATDSFDYQVCPDCGAVNNKNAATCTDCGRLLSAPTPQPPDTARGPLIPQLGPIIKVVAVCGIVALLGYLAFRGISAFVRSTEDTNPYPTAPDEAATKFFTHLQQEDYQLCYDLLVSSRKAAAVVNINSRDNYFRHFDRIRTYLAEHAGNDFLSSMEVSPNGRQVTFDEDIVLTVAFETSHQGQKTHYAINQINEFPMDVAPGLGVEKYNRKMNRIMESLDAIGTTADQSDDPIDLIQSRPEENPRQREKRLIHACKNARQLDTRHTLLEWIIKEFYGQPQTNAFLAELAADEKEPPQLRRLARQNIVRP